MSSSTAQDNKPGFAPTSTFSWKAYIAHRPVYPAADFSRIYAHHAQHSNKWQTAHDIGAGAGIASALLADKFDKVIISDPNDTYTDIARDRLVKELNFPESKFTFLKEGAENSSVESSSVDLISICEAIHWTDIPLAISDFARQLKSGGTLAVVYYNRPYITNNEAASEVWEKLWNTWVEELKKSKVAAVQKAFKNHPALENIAFPKEDWELGTKRIWINTRGNGEVFKLGKAHWMEEYDSLATGALDTDERIYVEDHEGWMDERDSQWLRGVVTNFVPLMAQYDVGDLWEELDGVIGDGKVKVAWPALMLLATKK